MAIAVEALKPRVVWIQPGQPLIYHEMHRLYDIVEKEPLSKRGEAMARLYRDGWISLSFIENSSHPVTIGARPRDLKERIEDVKQVMNRHLVVFPLGMKILWHIRDDFGEDFLFNRIPFEDLEPGRLARYVPSDATRMRPFRRPRTARGVHSYIRRF